MSGWADMAKEVLAQVEFVMEAVTFAEFIMEEALQSAFFGVNTAIANKDYDLAKMMLDLIDDELLPHFDTFVSRIGYLAPYSWIAFQDFGKSCHNMRNIQRAALNYW